MQQPLAYIPSPSRGVVHLGPLPLRAYALMIILGVVAAVWLGERRWAARGGTPGTVVDVAVWAVPFGLVGARLYHVITDYERYFGKPSHIAGVFEVWNGGLGIWGAIALGALGAYLACRRRGVSLRAFADAVAPGIALAQAFGRWGNWFNQELYGRPTKLPWAVKIDRGHRVSTPDIATYHPTFLYESLWCVGVALLVIWAEKRFRLAYGRAFALYVAAYTVGRAWIEWLRVDEAHHILGLRLNDWTSLVVFLSAVVYLYYYRDRTEIPEGAVGRAASETDTPAKAVTPEPSDAEPQAPDDGEQSATEPRDAVQTEAPTAAQQTTAAKADEEAQEAKDAKAAEEVEVDEEADTPAAEPNSPAESPESADLESTESSEPSEPSVGSESGAPVEPAENGATASGDGGAREKAATGAEPGERKS